MSKLGLHGDWHVVLKDVDGRVLEDYWKHNILHDLGEQQMLQGMFAPLGTLAEVLCQDCSFVHGTLTLADVDTAGTFTSTVLIGDKLYLVGGTDNEVVPGIWEVATVPGANSVTLTVTAHAGGVAGGVVPLRSRRLAIGLDARTALAETDTIATAEAYEEDGTGYSYSHAGYADNGPRRIVNPMDSTKWTIAQDADTGDYQATSAQVTFTAGGTNWQANRNAFLVSFTGLLNAPANEVLLSSVALNDPITVADAQSLILQFRLRLREAS
jgi:hypothetical protein